MEDVTTRNVMDDEADEEMAVTIARSMAKTVIIYPSRPSLLGQSGGGHGERNNIGAGGGEVVEVNQPPLG